MRVYQISNMTQLAQINQHSGQYEIVIGEVNLSRFCSLDCDELEQLAVMARESGHKVTLLWDAIHTEKLFAQAADTFVKINKDLFDAIRVQDMGAAQFAYEMSELPLQLICESRNHNLLALKSMQQMFDSRLEKIVLSFELPKEKIVSYQKELSCALELLAAGRILLFYSPRELLSPLIDKDKALLSDHSIEELVSSEESPHKNFPVLQNRHGSFMFHPKRLDISSPLENLSVDRRFDLRFDEEDQITELLKSGVYPFESIKGFFNINKSNVLFKKLKNQRIQRQDKNYIGEVVSLKSKAYTVIRINKGLVKAGDSLLIHTPENKEKNLVVHSIKSLSGADMMEAKKGELVRINYFRGVGVKSQLYKGSAFADTTD